MAACRKLHRAQQRLPHHRPKTQGLLTLQPSSQALMTASSEMITLQNCILLHHRQETHGLLSSLALLIITDGGPQSAAWPPNTQGLLPLMALIIH